VLIIKYIFDFWINENFDFGFSVVSLN